MSFSLVCSLLLNFKKGRILKKLAFYTEKEDKKILEADQPRFTILLMKYNNNTFCFNEFAKISCSYSGF